MGVSPNRIKMYQVLGALDGQHFDQTCILNLIEFISTEAGDSKQRNLPHKCHSVGVETGVS